MILTDIDRVKLNYETPNEIDLYEISVAEAEKYLSDGHFTPGSMAPKMQAAIQFIKSGGKKSIIASLDQAADAIEGKAGTTILLS